MPELQGANLTGAELQGADLTYSEIWLARFPFGLAEQSPGPLGLADLKMSPLTKEAKARLRADLQDNITDGKLLERVMDRLDPIQRDDPPKWDDEEKWRQSIAGATEPSPGEFVPFLAGMACRDRGGHIANNMARRALRYSRDTGRRHYAKPLAEALLDENCQGAKALTDETRGRLENLVAATE
jgi:hypothetical protein